MLRVRTTGFEIFAVQKAGQSARAISARERQSALSFICRDVLVLYTCMSHDFHIQLHAVCCSLRMTTQILEVPKRLPPITCTTAIHVWIWGGWHSIRSLRKDAVPYKPDSRGTQTSQLQCMGNSSSSLVSDLCIYIAHRTGRVKKSILAKVMVKVRELKKNSAMRSSMLKTTTIATHLRSRICDQPANISISQSYFNRTRIKQICGRHWEIHHCKNAHDLDFSEIGFEDRAGDVDKKKSEPWACLLWLIAPHLNGRKKNCFRSFPLYANIHLQLMTISC